MTILSDDDLEGFGLGQRLILRLHLKTDMMTLNQFRQSVMQVPGQCSVGTTRRQMRRGTQKLLHSLWVKNLPKP